MSELYYSVCDYCPRMKNCTAYTCNMRDELDDEINDMVIDYLKKMFPPLVKEWMKENKIVKED